MKLEDIPYGNDFALLIPCDSEVQGCLSIEICSDGAHMTIGATDDKGGATVFIDNESQALMVIAAMQAFIGKIRKTEQDDRSPK